METIGSDYLSYTSRMLALWAVIAALAGAATEAPDPCRSLVVGKVTGVSAWHFHKGHEIEVCLPVEWRVAPGGMDEFEAAPNSDTRILFVQFLPNRDASYTDFRNWQRGFRIQGRSLRVGGNQAVRDRSRPGGPGTQVSTFIAVPYSGRQGGIVYVFGLTTASRGQRQAQEIALYDQMLKSLRLLEPTSTE
jgi:hypothetical protein